VKVLYLDIITTRLQPLQLVRLVIADIEWDFTHLLTTLKLSPSQTGTECKVYYIVYITGHCWPYEATEDCDEEWKATLRRRH